MLQPRKQGSVRAHIPTQAPATPHTDGGTGWLRASKGSRMVQGIQGRIHAGSIMKVFLVMRKKVGQQIVADMHSQGRHGNCYWVDETVWRKTQVFPFMDGSRTQ